MTPIRAAFVMEQTLGHVTHFRNLEAVTANQSAVLPTWLPIAFDVRGVERFLPLLRSNWSVRASWRARTALRSALAQQAHQAVVFHTQVTSLFSIGTMRRVPSLISLDATPLNYDTVGRHYGHRPAGSGLVDRQKHALNRKALQAADGLVAWSDWARASLVRDYAVDPSRIRILAPGAAPAYFHIGSRRHLRPPAAGSRAEPVRLLFVGGDFRRKGGLALLECMQRGLADRCELHVVTREDVAEQRNVYVHRGLGPNGPELLQLFAMADVFVLPSLAECLAVVLMEATAAGLPVVTTDVGALREAVHPGESGLLVGTGDTDALFGALTTLAGDAGLRRRMGREGYRLAREKFDAQQNNRALLALVSEVVEARRGMKGVA